MTDKIFTAKTGNNYSEWLSLNMHLKDTAGIMEYLIENFLSDSFGTSFSTDKDRLKSTAVFIAGVHDIGKATISFQMKITRNMPDCLSRLEHY